MALAGVALAVQPRQAEEEPGHADDRLWNRVARITTIAAVGADRRALRDLAAARRRRRRHRSIDLFDPFTNFLTIGGRGARHAARAWSAGRRSSCRRAPARPRGAGCSRCRASRVVVIALFALASDAAGPVPLARRSRSGTARSAARARRRRAPGRCRRGARGLARPGPRHRGPRRPGHRLARDAAAARCSSRPPAPALFAVAMVLAMITDDFEGGPIVVTVLAAGRRRRARASALTLLTDPRRNRVVLLGILGGRRRARLHHPGRRQRRGPRAPLDQQRLDRRRLDLAARRSRAYALTVPPEVRAAFGPLVTGTPAGPPSGYGQPPSQPPPHGPASPATRRRPSPAAAATRGQPGYQQPPASAAPPAPPQQPGGLGSAAPVAAAASGGSENYSVCSSSRTL